MDEMNVLKRDGTVELMSFDKILRRVRTLGKIVAPPLSLNYAQLVINIIDKLHDRIKTQQIDELTAQECASQVVKHPDFGELAGRIVVSNNHKSTTPSLAEVVAAVRPQLDDEYAELVLRHQAVYQDMLVFERDYLLGYFGYKTLERAYLMKSGQTVVERPQHMWLRVAIALHGDDFFKVKEAYDLMSLKYMTHATPTLFNAGTKHPQLSSCFLIAMKEDSIDGIFDTLADCAKISKWAGGIGLHVHNVRAKGSLIRGTNGTSNGLVPMLRTFNETARYVDQGGGKRNGSFSIYLSPEHPDIEAWLDLKKNTGDESARARDLFYALWVPDLFMRRVEENKEWSLFCPDACPGLNDVYGDAYVELYERYEREGRAVRTLPARTIWFKALDAQMETGNPSLLFKDACNAKSNQKNVGVIKSSNLCTEVVQYSDANETAVCNLASIALSAFVTDGVFDYAKLHAVTRTTTRNLNQVIDKTFYPTKAAERSNRRHRPIGIGVQGLADAFFKMNVAFYSDEAISANKRMFETMYHAAMTESVELAKEFGAYDSFAGSPLSQGQFQFDLWGVVPSGEHDWETLRQDLVRFGARNSLLVAPMPTASTSQILGNNECFEPITSNLYYRRTNAGEFVVVNHFLVDELSRLGLWNEQTKNSIIANNGSVQHMDLPDDVKKKYLTVWEIPMRHIIDMARDRGAFVCQSQSLNLFMAEPDAQRLTSMHFYAWKQGLKTGLYYLRRRPRYRPQQVTLEPTECVTCSA
jgi:ribonucleoside-diphosphate reductase alpha subunit